ncbi:hypothetical protein QMG83_03375 [Salinibacterium sp. G-O1]|nr:hypothetical protein [Salinibacterium sp. G-O1]MDJ0334260.1 hypothetical protein [Salinibacterium sp. G-O1]
MSSPTTAGNVIFSWSTGIISKPSWYFPDVLMSAQVIDASDSSTAAKDAF